MSATFPTVTPVPSAHDIPADDKPFGPDFTKTEQSKSPLDDKKPAKPPLFSSLGANKKTRSSVRKLTDEDRMRLHAWYMRIAAMTLPFHPKLSLALQTQAEDCVTTWSELAENNDNVRRRILAVIEGGDWGKVIMAHAPIFIAAIPEKLLEKIINGSMLAALFQHEPSMSEPEEAPQYPADLNVPPPFERREAG